MQKCSGCKELLPSEAFNKKQRACKRCRAKYYKAHYAKNKEKFKEYNASYVEKHREKVNQYTREWYRNLKATDTKGYLWRAAKGRAKKHGLDFSISVDDINIPQMCPVLNIPLFVSEQRNCHNSPSIDRIDSSKGYVPGNVIVVSWRANWIKNNATPIELKKIADFYGSLSGRF